MRETVIVTDSACDLSDEILKKYSIEFISLRLICSEGEYRDRTEISIDKVFEILKKEQPTTSLPRPEDVETLYTKLYEQGVKNVIHICISSGLSGTYNMVNIIAEDFKDKLNIKVVDSKTLSMGLGEIVIAAGEAMLSGASPDEIVEVAKKVREEQACIFVIPTLEHLRKGGRIGRVEGAVGSLLNIKPVIKVNDEGVYITIAKGRGFVKAKNAMINQLEYFKGRKIKVAVVHGSDDSKAIKLLETIKSSYDVVESWISPVSAILAVHTGDGLLGVITYPVS